MEKLLKLTSYNGETILIGIDNIISVTEETMKPLNEEEVVYSKIYSRSAMASSYWVLESIDEIYKQYKGYEK